MQCSDNVQDLPNFRRGLRPVRLLSERHSCRIRACSWCSRDEKGNLCTWCELFCISPNPSLSSLNVSLFLPLHQPISCSINAEPIDDYPGGIVNAPSASKEPNHVISVVGFGVDDKGTDYWIVRNSVSFAPLVSIPPTDPKFSPATISGFSSGVNTGERRVSSDSRWAKIS